MEKNIVVDRLSMIPLNINKKTSQKSTYQQETVSEIDDNEEIPAGTFPINLKWTKRYQPLEPIIRAKYKDGT